MRFWGWMLSEAIGNSDVGLNPDSVREEGRCRSIVGRVITPTELRERLLRSGHQCAPGTNGAATGSNVWVSPDTIVTIALDEDPTFRRPFRERYFACLLESEANPVPVLQFEPEFALPGHFETIAAERQPAEGFMTGPFRWLLRRLVRHRYLLLWPAREIQQSVDRGFASSELLGNCPELQQWLCAAATTGAEVGALVLDMAERIDCRILWTLASHVAQSLQDFHVGDLECREVYQMHHHDKVMVCIPDATVRQDLVQELIDRSDVIEDCSGYASPMDDAE